MDCHAILMRRKRKGLPFRKRRFFRLNKSVFDDKRKGRWIVAIAELSDVSMYSLCDYLYHGNCAPLNKAQAISQTLGVEFDLLWTEKE